MCWPHGNTSHCVFGCVLFWLFKFLLYYKIHSDYLSSAVSLYSSQIELFCNFTSADGRHGGGHGHGGSHRHGRGSSIS